MFKNGFLVDNGYSTHLRTLQVRIFNTCMRIADGAYGSMINCRLVPPEIPIPSGRRLDDNTADKLNKIIDVCARNLSQQAEELVAKYDYKEIIKVSDWHQYKDKYHILFVATNAIMVTSGHLMHEEFRNRYNPNHNLMEVHMRELFYRYAFLRCMEENDYPLTTDLPYLEEV